MADTDARIAVRGLSKDYSGVRVLDGVDLEIRSGEIHALVGENGAGKSTLIKIVVGVTAPTAGTIEIGGQSHSAMTPGLARSLGLRIVAQEREACPDVSVGENVLLGRLPTRSRIWGAMGFLDFRRQQQEAKRRLARVGLDFDPRTPMRELGVAETQAVEIARAVSDDARVIIMDEPTSALEAGDISNLLTMLRRLRDEGVAIVYVSHHLEEVLAIADTVTVLREGKLVVTRPLGSLTIDELVTLMLGQKVERLKLCDGACAPGDVLIRVEDVSKLPMLDRVSVNIRQGEVLAIVGGLGSGRHELGRVIAGSLRPDEGSVMLAGCGRISRPRDAAKGGMCFLSADRRKWGILADRDLVDNIDVGWLATTRSFIDRPARRYADACRQVKTLRVKTRDVFQPIRLLSGGNQQKVLIARWVNVGVKALLLESPTEGIDIGSRLEIFRLLREMATRGLAVVVLSSDLEEVDLIADRAIVMRGGRVSGELIGEEISEESLMHLQYSGSIEIPGPVL